MLSRIEKYFNGELSEKEALEMQIWLAGHSDDPEVVKEIDRVFDAMSETAIGDGSCDAGAGRVFAGIRDRLGLGRASKRNADIFRRIERAAAIMAIPLMLAAGILYMKSERPEVAWLEVNVPSRADRHCQPCRRIHACAQLRKPGDIPAAVQRSGKKGVRRR